MDSKVRFSLLNCQVCTVCTTNLSCQIEAHSALMGKVLIRIMNNSKTYSSSLVGHFVHFCLKVQPYYSALQCTDAL